MEEASNMRWIFAIMRWILFFLYSLAMIVIVLILLIPLETFSLIPAWQYARLGIRFLMLIGFWAYIAIRTRREKRQAGPVLLDLGRLGHVRSKIAKIFLVALSLLYALLLISGGGIFIRDGIGFLVKGLETEGMDKLSLGFFLLSIGALSVMSIWKWNRLEIRGNGIFLFIKLLRWEKIESYQWKGKKGYTLALKLKGRSLLSFSLTDYSISPAHKGDVDRLLTQHFTERN